VDGKIGYKLTRKAKSNEHYIEGQFRVNKYCWSAIFKDRPIWFAEKGNYSQGDLQKRRRRSYCAITGAEQGAQVSRLAAILIAIYRAISKPDSCSYCGFDRGPEPLIYKSRPSPSLRSSSSFLLRLKRIYVHFFLIIMSIFFNYA
jgi:hypothetical protein